MAIEMENNTIKWINPLFDQSVKLYGFYWQEQNKEHIYRFPFSAKEEIAKVSPKVAALAGNTSGGQIHFRTNSPFVKIKVKLNGFFLMSGMTPVGMGGFDCYVGKTFDELRFFDTSRFEPHTSEYEYTFFEKKDYDKIVVINFPLYCSVESVELGISDTAMIQPAESFKESERIVVYGTSITQGGCASRAGMSYTNILSRRMKREWLNFGFSGNAFGEHEIIELIASVKSPSLFIIDYEANSGTNGKLVLTLEDIISTIRKNHPMTDLAIISRIPYLFDELDESLGTARQKLKEFQIQTVNNHQQNGDKHIYFIDGSKLLGSDYHECTIDSVHPTDLGFMRIAENLRPELEKILSR